MSPTRSSNALHFSALPIGLNRGISHFSAKDCCCCLVQEKAWHGVAPHQASSRGSQARETIAGNNLAIVFTLAPRGNLALPENSNSLVWSGLPTAMLLFTTSRPSQREYTSFATGLLRYIYKELSETHARCDLSTAPLFVTRPAVLPGLWTKPTRAKPLTTVKQVTSCISTAIAIDFEHGFHPLIELTNPALKPFSTGVISNLIGTLVWVQINYKL